MRQPSAADAALPGDDDSASSEAEAAEPAASSASQQAEAAEPAAALKAQTRTTAEPGALQRAGMARRPSARELEQQFEEEEGTSSSALHAAALARSFLIGKLILLPKFKLKAAGWFQPEDHASRLSPRLSRSPFTRRAASALNYGGIYGCGVLLFEGHAFALRRLRESAALDGALDEVVDEDTARAGQSALAGAFGGMLYAVSSTPLVSLLRLGGPSKAETWRRWLRRAVRRPLPWTVARDAGGFALYFGSYSFARTSMSPQGQGAEPPAPGATGPAGTGTGLADALSELASALTAGSLAGVATYLWRSPFDTLYKVKMGWRPPHAPLLSPRRFVTSPRGLKAVGISGVTWAVYELALLGVRELTARGYIREEEPVAAEPPPDAAASSRA